METEFDLKVFSVKSMLSLLCVANMYLGHQQVTHCGLLYTSVYPGR